jgi:hypothetical protein
MIEHTTGLISQTPMNIGIVQDLEEKKETGKKEDKKDDKHYSSMVSLHRLASVHDTNYCINHVVLPSTPVIDYLTPPPDKTELF